MRGQLYKKRPSTKHTYIYQVQFVGHKPLVIKSNEPEYFKIKLQAESLANKGELEMFSIEPKTKALVERLDHLQIHYKTEEAEQVWSDWVEDLNALNRRQPPHPSDLTRFLEEDDNNQTEIGLLMREYIKQEYNIDKPTFEQFALIMLEQKYSYLFQRLKDRWKKSEKASTSMEV